MDIKVQHRPEFVPLEIHRLHPMNNYPSNLLQEDGQISSTTRYEENIPLGTLNRRRGHLSICKSENGQMLLWQCVIRDKIYWGK